MNIKELWQIQLEKQKLKYFVIKVSDFFDCLTEREVFEFNKFLEKFNKYREQEFNKPVNRYLVINKDEYNINDIYELENILKDYEKI